MNDRYFRTSSFYPAAFLLAKGAELVNIDKITDSRRASFVFCDPAQCEDWLHVFNFGKDDEGDAVVDARKMVVAIKTLKEKLYQN
ncbi:MAG: DUF5659 domain-containing protein [Candidatus Peregrinibacteria bacterium]|nr:DUF5659 domain-containing protein [Candidatus Peregrinibacteria bacterium]